MVFGVMGTFNTVTCYALYAAMVHWFHWNYNFALVLDYAFGAVLGFTVHRIATFADRKHVRLAFGKFAVTLVLSFLLNVTVLNAAVERLLLDPLVAQLLALVFVTLFSYTMQKHWVFRSHPARDLELDAAADADLELEVPLGL
jgi:putative flippase GtrA